MDTKIYTKSDPKYSFYVPQNQFNPLVGTGLMAGGLQDLLNFGINNNYCHNGYEEDLNVLGMMDLEKHYQGPAEQNEL